MWNRVKKDFPHIKVITDRSDNAGCYSSATIILTKVRVTKDVGLVLKYTEFNEPQKGKDQCDRDAAVIKRHIISYWHSGHDISNSPHGGGVQNVKPSITEVNTTYSDLDKVVLPGIQSYHSFEFHSEEAAFCKYHKIGEGQQIRLEDIHCTPSYKVVREDQKPFPAGHPARASAKPSASSKSTNHLGNILSG